LFFWPIPYLHHEEYFGEVKKYILSERWLSSFALLTICSKITVFIKIMDVTDFSGN
jgi:hypothetical protein